MTTPPSDLVNAYTMSRACEVCTNEVQSSPREPCRHVICQRCDVGFKEQYPDHQCGLCQMRSSGRGRRDSDEGTYAKPVPQPRRVMRRPSVLSETCDSCGNKETSDTFCQDCSMHICSDCVRQHSSMAILKRHVLVSRALPKPPPKLRVSEQATTAQLDSVNEPTLEELSREVSSRLSAVSQRSSDLIREIEQADRVVQAHTKMTLQGIAKRADQMKRDIDEDVKKQTELVSSEGRRLLIRLKKRKEFIALQASKIKRDLSHAQDEAGACLRRINRQSLDTDGYTQMSQYNELMAKRISLRKKLEEMDELFRELNFDYTAPSDSGESLGKLKTRRKIFNVTETRVQRFQSEDSYTATAMTSAPVDCILFTSCKGADKAAADLVNINGNPLHTRKLQDRGQDPSQTPAYAALIEAGIVAIGWETSIFSMKIASRDEVNSFSVREFLVPGANVCCLTVDHDRRRIIFGNNKNRIINVVSFEMKHVTTVTLKEECSPPTSLACWDTNLLVADSVDAAFAADSRGNTIAQFLPPQMGDMKPIAVAACGATAYVLWVTRSMQPTNPTAYVQSYDLAEDSVGEHVSNALRVPDDARFIAVISAMDDDDRLVVGTCGGNISIYCVQEM